MTYTHHFPQKRACSARAWNLLLGDLVRLYHALPAHVLIGPPSGNLDDGHMILNEQEISFNGVAGGTGESFWISRAKQRESFAEYCRTGGKPYDLFVTATLLLMEHHAPGAWTITSTGTLDDFALAADWIETTLGHPVIPEALAICERSAAHAEPVDIPADRPERVPAACPT